MMVPEATRSCETWTCDWTEESMDGFTVCSSQSFSSRCALYTLKDTDEVAVGAPPYADCTRKDVELARPVMKASL